ncbi:38K protein [Penaeus monodon nudivirus]|uniref:38K protein n=2 Tax=Lefavirales TaxID=2840070 RepID=A0A076FCA4_9VIRU|nr:38K protein [Penaeus monodon nudivirus]ABX44705.1 hypothetical protein [Penaeus monodon nucleopolyhedrovirus]AII15847.1 38K protein [Penaeus monodon nudivirus]
MKNGVFINCKYAEVIPNDVMVRFISICYNKFTHVYVVSGCDYKQVFKLGHIRPYNSDDDAPGLYFIKEINNNIRYYSILLNVNDFKCQTQNYNIHVDFKYISIDKNFNEESFINDVDFYINSFYGKKKKLTKKSIVVIDLDDTIINRDGDIIIENFKEYFNIIKRTFDLVVLWSHGCQRHVNHILENALSAYRYEFDMIIVRNSALQVSNKGIGFMLKQANVRFNVEEFTQSLLIDDQSCNYLYDYDYFIHVPKGLSYNRYNKQMWKMLYALQDCVTERLNI